MHGATHFGPNTLAEICTPFTGGGDVEEEDVLFALLHLDGFSEPDQRVLVDAARSIGVDLG